jgi:hypothetical protein
LRWRWLKLRVAIGLGGCRLRSGVWLGLWGYVVMKLGDWL